MFFLGIILISMGGWLVDCGVQGRHPITDIEALVSTGTLPADAAVQVTITPNGKGGGSASWSPLGTPIPINNNALTGFDAHGNVTGNGRFSIQDPRDGSTHVFDTQAQENAWEQSSGLNAWIKKYYPNAGKTPVTKKSGGIG